MITNRQTNKQTTFEHIELLSAANNHPTNKLSPCLGSTVFVETVVSYSAEIQCTVKHRQTLDREAFKKKSKPRGEGSSTKKILNKCL